MKNSNSTLALIAYNSFTSTVTASTLALLFELTLTPRRLYKWPRHSPIVSRVRPRFTLELANAPQNAKNTPENGRVRKSKDESVTRENCRTRFVFAVASSLHSLKWRRELSLSTILVLTSLSLSLKRWKPYALFSLLLLRNIKVRIESLSWTGNGLVSSFDPFLCGVLIAEDLDREAISFWESEKENREVSFGNGDFFGLFCDGLYEFLLCSALFVWWENVGSSRKSRKKKKPKRKRRKNAF